jgi:L-lactate dehydrogenase
MDLKRIMPASIKLEGEYGISGAALSLPCVIGKNGVERVLTPPLSESRRNALKKSAAAVMDIIAGAKP